MKAASKQYIERISVIMKKRRIALDMKQSEAAEKAGISLGTLRKFEQSGEISLERFSNYAEFIRWILILWQLSKTVTGGPWKKLKAESKRTVR